MNQARQLLNLLRAGLIGIVMLAEAGCGLLSNVQVTTGPWLSIPPGQSLPSPYALEVIKSGQGPAVAPGDLVQFHVKVSSEEQAGDWIDLGDWWLWAGQLSSKDTAFYDYAPALTSALITQRLGSQLKILSGPKVEISRNPLGSPRTYFDSIHSTQKITVDPPDSLGRYTVIELKRVCKGNLQYRTTHLFDDTPVMSCPTPLPLGCTKLTTPSEVWMDAARMEAICNDERKVVFEYGPVVSKNDKDLAGPPYRDSLRMWSVNYWHSLHTGVEFVGNHAPVAMDDHGATIEGTPVTINLLANDRDPDGDKLSVRVGLRTHNGYISNHGDGTITYTPRSGCVGVDEFRYSASDTMAEATATVKIFTKSTDGGQVPYGNACDGKPYPYPPHILRMINGK